MRPPSRFGLSGARPRHGARSWRLPLPWVLALALLSLPNLAWAQRVLIVKPPPGDPILLEAFGRLRAELSLHAFEVVVLESPSLPLDTSRLESETQEHGAFSAIALIRKPSGTTADVCIVDRVTGKTTQRKLAIESSADGPTLLAIRAVDLLRASLLELAPGQSPPPDVLGVDASPPPPQLREFTAEPRRFQVRIGAALFLEPNLGAALGVHLALRTRPLQRLALGIQFTGPAFGGEYENASGAASVRQEYALFDASWNFGSVSSGARLEWGPRLGAGLSHFEATGNVTQPLISRTADIWGLALEAGAGAEYFWNDTLSLSLELNGLTTWPRPILAIHETQSDPISLQLKGTLSLGVSF